MIGIGKQGVALMPYDQIDPIFEGQISPPVGQGIGLFLVRQQQHSAHAGAGLDIPLADWPLLQPLPDGLLFNMSARVIATRDKGRGLVPNGGQGRRDGWLGPRPGRIGGRPEQDKIIVHDGRAADAEASGDERFFLRRGMSQQDVHLPRGGDAQYLTRTGHHRFDRYAVLFLKDRVQCRHQARAFRGRGDRKPQRFGLGAGQTTVRNGHRQQP